MRLIDADALIGKDVGIALVSTEAIRNASTIDAVPVVRCAECGHWEDPYCMLCKTRIGAGYHSRDMAYRKPDDFCSYGERKEGADGC